MQSLKIEFTVDKETKNTVRYAEVVTGVTALVGVIYVQKPTANQLGNPEKIVVTLEAVNS